VEKMELWVKEENQENREVQDQLVEREKLVVEVKRACQDSLELRGFRESLDNWAILDLKEFLACRDKMG